jgi:predicted kinase
MNNIIKLFVGNIASGKSTLAKSFHEKDNSIIVNADSLREMFGGGNYVFDKDIEDSTMHDTCLFLTEELMKLGKDLVIDETLMQKKHRQRYINLAKQYNYFIMVYLFEDYGKEEHVRRRMYSNSRGYDQSTWEEVYDKIKSKYEKPSIDEGCNIIIYV